MNGSNRPEGVVSDRRSITSNLVIDDGSNIKRNTTVSGTNIVIELDSVVHPPSPSSSNVVKRGYTLPQGAQFANVKKVNGKREGKAVVKKNKIKIAMLFYHDDLLSGMCSFYDDTGKLQEKVCFENDVAQGWSGICKDGAVDSLVYYDKGLKTKKLTKSSMDATQWKEESSEGEVLYEGEYNITPESLRGDNYKFYRKGNGNAYRNGEWYYVGAWDNDVPHGKGNLYDLSGEPCFSGFWENGCFRKPDGTVFNYLNDEPPQPVPNTPSQPVPSIPSQSVPSIPSQPVPNTPPQPVPNTLSQPVPSTPSQPVPSTPPQPDPVIPTKPDPNTPTKPESFVYKLNKPGAGKKQLIILISIIVVALILIIGCIWWCVWYVKGVDYTVCTPEDYKKIDFRMRSLNIPSNCLNDYEMTLLELKGYERLTYITIGDKSVRYGNGFRVIDCPKLKVITIGKESFNNVVDWEKSTITYDESRSVVIRNCPELTKITVGLGTFVAYDIFDISSLFG